MCDICRQSPCASNCPNAPDPIIVYICDGCGSPIYEGDEYYHLMDGNKYCEECIREARETAEVEYE